MTITKNAESILEHPYLKEAIEQFQQGNTKDMRHLLSELATHVYLTVASNCAKVYRGEVKNHNIPIVYGYIKDICPPTNLDIRLPIPPPKPKVECKVVKLTPKVKGYKDPKQLEIQFKANKKAPTLAEALVG